jgi:glutamate-5-semialdehyde dehydrogenase
MKDIAVYIDTVCRNARNACPLISSRSREAKDSALLAMATLVAEEKDLIQKENQKDLALGKKAGLTTAMLDRLTLSDIRIQTMIQSLKEVTALPDPVGRRYDERTRPNGLAVCRMRVPIGVILMIYESRPNVTVDSAALCLKSGNCVILRGGKEAINSNKILAELFQRALKKAGLPEYAIQLIETIDRFALDLLLKRDDALDLVMPRGGEELIRKVVQASTVPVIKHYKGVCHVYIHHEADFAMAKSIALNAKVQRPGVCNAMETLLIDRKVPESFIKELLDEFHRQQVTIRGCETVCFLDSKAEPATEEDWYAEYLDLILAVRVVDGLDDAVGHIAKYSSSHTESIVTKNRQVAEEFIKRVDSSSVMWNASTRFSDGGEYGLGAEIGISTDKLHARGPMGLEELTTYKWVVVGNGQVRE